MSRKKQQRYVHWMFESPAHLQYDVTPLSRMEGFFNWSMSYRLDSTFPVPYGLVEQYREHPSPGIKLDTLIKTFGTKNVHLADKPGHRGKRSEFRRRSKLRAMLKSCICISQTHQALLENVTILTTIIT